MKLSIFLRLLALIAIGFLIRTSNLLAQTGSECTFKKVIQPDDATGKDAFVHSKTGYENTNFGTSPSFDAMTWTFQGNPGTLREFFDFDLSFIPVGATILSAQLELFGKTELNGGAHSCLSGNNDFNIRRVTSAWTEMGVTWNNQPSTTTLNEVTMPPLCTPAADVSINVQALIQDIVSNPATSFGLEMNLVTESYYRGLIFHSSESGDAARRPKLVLAWSQPCPCTKTLALQPDDATGKDAFVHSKTGYENTNFGTSPSFDAMTWTFQGTPGTLREFFDFDLTSIPLGAVVVSAQLELFGKIESNGGSHSCLSGNNDFNIRRVTSAWTEMGVTWNNQPSTTTLNEVTMPPLCTPAADVSINVAALIQDIVNSPATSFGLEMNLVTEAFYRSLIFHSSESGDAARRPKLTVVYEIPCPCEGNIVQNGTFSDGIVQGNLGGPGNSNNWFVGFNTPQAITHDSCAEIGAMQMWGNQVVGEGIFQPVNFIAGQPYSITFCGKWDPSVQGNVQFRFRASNGGPLGGGDYNNLPGTTEDMWFSPILTTSWATYTTLWTPVNNQDHLNITVWNNFNINDGAYVSWARIDDICITKAGLVLAADDGPKITAAPLEATLSPNPTFDETTLRFASPLAEKSTLRLFDLTGRMLRQTELAQATDEFSLNLENLPAGIYLLEVQAKNGENLRKKIVKQ